MTWSDGTVSVVDFGPIILQGGVFTPMADDTFFAHAALGVRGRVLCWPGDIDFCADAMFEIGHVPTMS
jgi:hypothetical protein